MKTMYRLAIDKLARENGITAAYQLQRDADLNPNTAAALFKGETQSIKTEVINKLHFAYGWTPEQMFELVEVKTKKKSPKNKA